MPEQLSVSEFVAVTSEDLSSPLVSGFATKMQKCRGAVGALEEVSGAGGGGGVGDARRGGCSLPERSPRARQGRKFTFSCSPKLSFCAGKETRCSAGWAHLTRCGVYSPASLFTRKEATFPLFGGAGICR